jgi:hypothetical protein
MTLSKKDKEYLKAFNKYKSDLELDDKIKLAREIAIHFEKSYTNLRTITAKITQAKKYFREKTNDPKFYKNINPKKEITQSVIKKNVKKLETEREFQEVKASDIEAFLDEFRESLNIYELGFYILLNTGRRLSAIVDNIDKFTNKPNSKNEIYFRGILKKRTDKDQRVAIMTIDNKLDVLGAIRNFKKLLKKRNKTSFKRSLQRHIKKISGKYNFTSHSLRSVYCNYLFTKRNPHNQIYNSYIRERLNHKNLLTSINYSDIKIV